MRTGAVLMIEGFFVCCCFLQRKNVEITMFVVINVVYLIVCGINWFKDESLLCDEE